MYMFSNIWINVVLAAYNHVEAESLRTAYTSPQKKQPQTYQNVVEGIAC